MTRKGGVKWLTQKKGKNFPSLSRRGVFSSFPLQRSLGCSLSKYVCLHHCMSCHWINTDAQEAFFFQAISLTTFPGGETLRGGQVHPRKFRVEVLVWCSYSPAWSTSRVTRNTQYKHSLGKKTLLLHLHHHLPSLGCLSDSQNFINCSSSRMSPLIPWGHAKKNTSPLFILQKFHSNSDPIDPSKRATLDSLRLNSANQTEQVTLYHEDCGAKSYTDFSLYTSDVLRNRVPDSRREEVLLVLRRVSSKRNWVEGLMQ